jgi:MEDS: MEthanogen/methylotroph, DcmR Sensory domain
MPEDFQSQLDVPEIAARHLVSFYKQPHYPVDAICDYLAEGLSAGEAAIAVSTREHAESITRVLQSRGCSVDEMKADGRLVCADAIETLAYLQDQNVARGQKEETMNRWVKDSVARAPAHRCRILGELVSLMVAQGNLDEAIALEEHWNHLLAEYPAMLYCVYEQAPFENSHALNRFCDICNRHDVVLATHLREEASKESPAWFVLLQEQASALREEVMRRRLAERLVFVNEANRLMQLEGLLRAHGPNLSPLERDGIVKVVTELKAKVRKEKWAAVPESPEWYKKAGEILGYEKVIAGMLRTERKPNGDPNVS